MSDKSTYFNISLIALCVLFTVIFLIYMSINSTITPKAHYTSTLSERIAPIGNVYIEGDIDITAVAAVPAAASSARSGEEVYNNAGCSVCHAIGVAGAPKYGDVAAWAPRIKTGISTLLSSVTNGKGAMSAKGGCMDCSSEELEAAINYLINVAK